MTTLDLSEGTPTNRLSTANEGARPSNNRRSVRVTIEFCVTVFGQNSDGKIFAEKTKTVTVNAHGALVVLEAHIDPQKPALLVNTKTGTEVQCRIAHRKETEKSRFEIGLEFASPQPKFWGMNFPPEDWDPADRKKANSPHRPNSPSRKVLNR